MIARYKEDVSWLKRLSGYRVYVYNKFYKEGLQLPNIGREAHTYVHHIVENYEKLDTISIFLQGDPFAHGADLFSKLERINEKTQFVSLGDGTITWPDAVTDLPFEWLFGRRCPSTFVYRGGALLAIHKDRIRRHKKEFYQKLMEFLKKDELAPWKLERMWGFIFTSNLDQVLKFNK